ncbi:hypothetical protein EV643_103190 [Kribbella sp. VKM Ac-2527]|uniref:Uncharacterized protein n=1 Tax=Kribbella caucasensis TaxID=2512215 RepID=A0A4R6KJY7_9ACTN|nr:hypothetical protein [Kribbella sp. VKM Ac-2527]TDO51453.1 hypothetical protein EV643_103190 [Kribbella sp. VKM Ac-2527]
MNNLNDTLPDLMRRATEDLEPESTDLVERGMRRGAVLRRRRTALLSVSGAAAVLATAGIIVGGSTLFAGAGGDTSVAGTTNPPTPMTSVKPTPIPAVTPQETLATLKKLVAPSGAKITRPEARGGGVKDGFVAASVVLDDGKGLSLIDVLVEQKPKTNCTDTPTGSCTVRADGSVVVSLSESPEYPRDGNPGGVISNYVTVYRADGTAVHMTNYNAPLEKNAGQTRPKPVYSAAALVQLAVSKLWEAPPAVAGKPQPTDTGKVKPTK